MKFSIQLYTVRNELAADLRGTLTRLSSIGYRYVEMGMVTGMSPDDYRLILDDLGLKASGMHVPLEALESDLESVVSQAIVLGSNYVIVPWVASDRRRWHELGPSLDAIGKDLLGTGITLAYHNHDFEVAEDGLQRLFESASQEGLKAEIDVAWVQIGGADPAEWIRRLATRVPLVHLKDFDPEAKPIWVPAGEGQIDWDEALDACRDSAVEFGVVELDESPGSPLEAAKQSFDFFKTKGVEV